MGAGHATPMVFADGGVRFAGRRRRLDGETEAEHRVWHHPHGKLHRDAIRELIAAHLGQRGGVQNAHVA